MKYATFGIVGIRSRRQPAMSGTTTSAAEMQLRLGEEPPPAGTVFAVLEWTAELSGKRTGRTRMRECRTRRSVQLAAQDLRDEVFRNRA